MIFIIAWLVAMGTSELLLWSYCYLHLISPVLYIALCIMYLYQRRKIYINRVLNVHEKKIKSMKMGAVFLLSLLMMLTVTVFIRFFSIIYTGL